MSAGAAPAEAAILELLGGRAAGGSICPSEAARVLDPQGWRGRMAEVHAAARALAAAGAVELARGGIPAAPEALCGTYRIRRPPRHGAPASG